MLIDHHHISKIHITNFGSLSGSYEFDPSSIESNPSVDLAVSWALGNIRLTKRDVISPLRNYTAVALVILNPKLFLEDKEQVIIERRTSNYFRSEFYYNHRLTTLSFIRETLSLPYNEGFLEQMKQLQKRFNYS